MHPRPSLDPAAAGFLPPFQLSLAYTVLFYAVDGASLARLVPPGFHPLAWRGKSLLVLLLASYREAWSVTSGARGQPYREMAYLTPGYWQKVSGLHAFRMYVTDVTARAIGRDPYGFPKEMGQVSLEAGVGGIRATASRERGGVLLDVELQRRDDCAGRLQAFVMKCLAGRIPLLGRCLQDRGGVLAQSSTRQQIGRVDAIRVVRASVPELTGMGLLSPQQATRPLLAGWVPEARFRLEPPVP